MASRPTAGEVSVDLGGFKSSVDKQFSYLVRWIIGLYALIAAIIGGGFLLRADLGRIEGQIARSGAEIEGLRRDVSSLQQEMRSLQKSASDNTASQNRMLSAMQRQIASGFAEINNKLPAVSSNPLIALSTDEEQTIRTLLGVTAGPAKSAKYGIGDLLSGTVPFPDEVVAKVPKLKGFTYAKDPDNGSVLVADNRGRVVAVISPA